MIIKQIKLSQKEKEKLIRLKAKTGISAWNVPVSYTHLDVYKRQEDVYLEAMEETQNPSAESDKVGHAGMAGLSKRKLAQRILSNFWKRHPTSHDNQQKTRTGRIRKYPEPVRVLSLIHI